MTFWCGICAAWGAPWLQSWALGSLTVLSHSFTVTMVQRTRGHVGQTQKWQTHHKPLNCWFHWWFFVMSSDFKWFGVFVLIFAFSSKQTNDLVFKCGQKETKRWMRNSLTSDCAVVWWAWRGSGAEQHFEGTKHAILPHCWGVSASYSIMLTANIICPSLAIDMFRLSRI